MSFLLLVKGKDNSLFLKLVLTVNTRHIYEWSHQIYLASRDLSHCFPIRGDGKWSVLAASVRLINLSVQLSSIYIFLHMHCLHKHNGYSDKLVRKTPGRALLAIKGPSLSPENVVANRFIKFFFFYLDFFFSCIFRSVWSCKMHWANSVIQYRLGSM